MDIFGIIGTIGALLFFAKIFIHAYLEYKATGKFPSRYGDYNRFIYFGPVGRDAEEKYRSLKSIANMMYWVSILLFAVFLFDFNYNHKHQ